MKSATVPTYEITVTNKVTRYGTPCSMAKLALENFDPSQDRFIQIEDAVLRHFPDAALYGVRLMRPQEIKRLDEIDDHRIFSPFKLPNGLIGQLIELRIE